MGSDDEAAWSRRQFSPASHPTEAEASSTRQKVVRYRAHKSPGTLIRAERKRPKTQIVKLVHLSERYEFSEHIHGPVPAPGHAEPASRSLEGRKQGRRQIKAHHRQGAHQEQLQFSVTEVVLR